MNREELIALARKAGALEPFTMKGVFAMDGVMLEAFAAELAVARSADVWIRLHDAAIAMDKLTDALHVALPEAA